MFALCPCLVETGVHDVSPKRSIDRARKERQACKHAVTKRNYGKAKEIKDYVTGAGRHCVPLNSETCQKYLRCLSRY